MLKLIGLILLGVLLYDYFNPAINMDDVPIISSLGYNDRTLDNLQSLTREHLAVFKEHEPSAFLENDQALIDDLENLPAMKQVLRPLSEVLMALKDCAPDDCSREFNAYVDWLNDEIETCIDTDKTTLPCRVFIHLQEKLLDEEKTDDQP